MIVVVSALLASAEPLFAQSPPPPSLGSAGSFAVLGRSVSNSGSTTVFAGNVGTAPGPASGLSQAKFILGDPRLNDSLARQAQKDGAAAYTELASSGCTETITGNLGHGQILSPGVYCATQATVLTGSLTLDAGDIPDGVWIFKIDGSLITDAGSTVETIHEGRDNNVYWRIAGSATFGTKSVFAGNVLASADIRVENNATVSGRLLTPGAVSLTDAGVTICCAVLDMAPHILANGTADTDYRLMLTPKGGSGSYRFALAASDPPLDVTLTEQGSLTVRNPPAGVYKLALAISDSTGISCIRVYRLVICGPVTLSPLPAEPEACIPYDRQITADPAGLTFTSGELPAGLELSTSGRLHGTPTKVQDYDFTVTASDGFGCSSSRRYTGHISSRFKLLPETGVLPEGTVGMEYRQDLTAIGGSGNYTFTITGGGPFSLSPPATSESATRVLSGVPTTGGCYKFTVTVKTTACEVVASREYTLVIRPVPIDFIPADTTLPPATVCSRYCQQFSASACSGTYLLDVVAGALPTGLTFDSTTGILCGTPAEEGMYLFTVSARDGLGHASSHNYLLEVRDLDIKVERQLLPATACVYYPKQLEATGCGSECEFQPVPGPLPDGLDLSDTGFLSGTPTIPKDYTFYISVGPKGCPVKKIVPLDLTVLCNVTLSPSQLSLGRLGMSYNKMITASCGTPPYTFSIVSGSLPPGLIPCADGTVCGVPAALGCFNFRVRATDSASPACIGEQTYQICIVPVAAAAAPALSGWGLGILILLLIGCALVVVWRPQ
jgi:hypothetical protein